MKKIIGLFTFIWAASLLFAQQPSGSVSFQNNADSVIMSVIGNLDFPPMYSVSRLDTRYL